MPIVADMDREFRKALYESTEAGGEAEILTAIDNVKQLLGAAMQQHASIRSRFVSNMTPESRAALSVMGKDVSKSIGVLEEAHMGLQRRLNDVRRERSQTLSKNGFDDAHAEYAMLKGMADEINRSGVRLDERVRRDLRLRLSAAEIRLQQSA